MISVFGRVAPGLSGAFSLLVDLLFVLAAIPIATTLSAPAFGLFSNEQIPLALAVICAWTVSATALRHYDPWAQRGAFDDLAMVLVQTAAVTTVVAVVRIATSSEVHLPDPSMYALVVYGPLAVFRVLVARPLSRTEDPADEVLVIGTEALARVTAEDLECSRPRRNVIGFLALPGETPRGLGEKLLGTVTDLERCLESLPVSEVYIAADAVRQGEAMQTAVRVCETLGIPFALPAYSFRLDRARPADLRSIADGYIHYLNIDSKPRQMALKRLFDIVASGVALWLLLPLLLVVAALIKLTSKGPIFFRQVRVGLHGKTFHMLKFRSMVVNAEELKEKLAKQNEMSGPVFKMKNDPRITRIGRFIRKFSIDELPQLINVLRGDMTIVGPRPPVPKEVAQYQPWQRRRLSVRPGLTCIWQVSGRNQISFEQWMYLDMRYIDHWSLAKDLGLILQTVPVVLTGRGAS